MKSPDKASMTDSSAMDAVSEAGRGGVWLVLERSIAMKSELVEAREPAPAEYGQAEVGGGARHDGHRSGKRCDHEIALSPTLLLPRTAARISRSAKRLASRHPPFD